MIPPVNASTLTPQFSILMMVLASLTTLTIQSPLTMPIMMKTYAVPRSASYLAPTAHCTYSILGTITSY